MKSAKTRLVLTFTVLLILSYGFCHLVSAQSTPSAFPFLTYENPSLGIKIEYPKDWTPMDQDGLRFLSPKENDSDTFREDLVVARGQVNQLIDNLTALLKGTIPPLWPIVLSKGWSFHGNPAQNMTFTVNLPGNGTIKVLALAMTENNNIYLFRFAAQENRFDSYLSTINRMMDSFRTTK